MKIVVGLGNIGKEYDRTRHNVGFHVLDKWAHRYGLQYKLNKSLEGEIVLALIGGIKVLLLKPQTYMNESGRALRKCLQFYKCDPSDVLVVTDDIALPVGTVRTRMEGSPGGHNGLKDIERHLGTASYARVRIGVGDRQAGALTDHVLGRFSADEERTLAPVIEQSILLCEEWLDGKLGETTWHAS